MIYVMTHDFIGLVLLIKADRAFDEFQSYAQHFDALTARFDYFWDCSKLGIAFKTIEVIRKEGKTVRVVSLVSWELFDEHSVEYKESVIPAAATARVSVETGSTFGWWGPKARLYYVGINHFGSMVLFGLSVENVVAKAKEVL